MSQAITVTKKRPAMIRIALIAAIIVGVLFAAYAIAKPSGAYFFAENSANTATANSASFGMQIANGDNSQKAVNGFNLTYNNIAPGDNQAATFTVKNTGTVAGVLHISNVGQENPGLNTRSSRDYLTYSVDGYGTFPAADPSASTFIDLGTLNGGETKTFALRASLDPNAGNEWAGLTVKNTFRATLEQKH